MRAPAKIKGLGEYTVKEFKPEEAPPAPDTWTGPLDEWYVYWWLSIHVGTDNFQYQGSREGGRKYLGGVIADFIVYDRTPGLVINVQGQYWHRGSEAAAKDMLQKIQYMNMGYDVVFIFEQDIMTRLDYTMKMALLGIQLRPDQ